MDKSYLLLDLILYAECPLKLEFKNSNRLTASTVSDDKRIISYALRDTYEYYLQHVGLNDTPTVRYLSSFFSKQLMVHKRSMLPNDNTVLFNDTKSLIAAHDLVVNISSLIKEEEELVAVGYPLERTMHGSHIVDQVDMITLVHPLKKPKYVQVTYFDTSDRLPDEKDIGSILRAHFGYTIVLRELASTMIPVKCTILHLISNKRSEITLQKKDRINYPRIIKNLVKGIDHNVIVPRASPDTCSKCKWQNQCDWRLG